MLIKNIRTSVDVGNKNIHILAEGMNQPVVIPNILKDYEVEISNMKFGLFKKNYNPLNVIDATVVINGRDFGRKYLGKIALNKGGRDRDLHKTKHDSDDILFSLLVGVAISLLDLNNPISVKGEVGLGTNLPIDEYRNESNVTHFRDKIKGHHKVIFHSKEFKNAIVEFEIKEEQINILPEGTAALLNILTDDDGYIKEEYENLSDRVIITIDIGGCSIDVSAVQNLELVEDLISFSNRGTRYLEEKVLKEISLVYNYSIVPAQLDYYIREKDCKLPMGSGEIDIKDIVVRESKALAKDIVTSINNMIEVAPKNLKPQIAKIALTGGASTILSKYIEDEISGYDVIVSETALVDNVIGTFKEITNVKEQV